MTSRIELSSHFLNGLPFASVSSNLTLFRFPPVKRSVKFEHEYSVVDRSGLANIKGSFRYTPPVASSCCRRVASAITVLSQQEVWSFMAKKCVGDVVGDVVGEMVGDVVGDVVGEMVGDVVGDVVGEMVGEMVGLDVVGDTVGDSEFGSDTHLESHCQKSI